MSLDSTFASPLSYDTETATSSEHEASTIVGSNAAFRPMRICLLGYRSNPYSGGQGIYIKYLSKALVDMGHEVDVISGPPYPDLDPRVTLIELASLNLFEVEHHIRALKLSHLKSWADFSEWFSMATGGFGEPYAFGRRLVHHFRHHAKQYDIVHDNQSLCWGMLKLQTMGLNTVTTIHHPITSDKKIALAAETHWFSRLLIRRWHHFLSMQTKVVKKLDNIITVSDCSRKDISEAFGIDAKGIDLVYNGIDTNQFRPLTDIARQPFRLMATASADVPLKGLDYLLRAVALLLPKYPQLRLQILGKPKPDGVTEKLIDQLGIREVLDFASGVSSDEITRMYARAELAVVPSVYEGFGLPAGEAMACGCPVVSTRGGALPEVVGDAGILVPIKDEKALAQAISRLLDDSELRNHYGKKGRKHIVENFSWQVAAKQMTRFYQSVQS